MSAPMCAPFASFGLVYAHKTRTVREVVMSNDMPTREHAEAEVYKLAAPEWVREVLAHF